MRLPMKPAVLAEKVIPIFDKIYSVVTYSTSQSTPSVKYYAYDNEKNYSTGSVVYTSVPSYSDDNITIDYYISGGRVYFRFTLKADAVVNGVQQSAGYSTSWIYSSFVSYFIVFG